MGGGRGFGQQSPLGGLLGGRRGRGRGRGGAWKIRLLIAFALVAFAVVKYFGTSSVNPITGKSERVGHAAAQDVAFGLQAAPEMAAQFGGPARDAAAQARVKQIGRELEQAIYELYADTLEDQPFEFSYTLLEDDNTINAFALPGGPTFITEALYRQLPSDAEIAGVMGHEIGHVIERHGAERMAKQELMSGITGAVAMGTGDYTAANISNMVGNFIQMSYGRDQELECDAIGLQLMATAGYDPRAMLRVMEVLQQAGGGGPRQPEWASTHPSPENRLEKIQAMIDQMYPNGVPEGLRR